MASVFSGVLSLMCMFLLSAGGDKYACIIADQAKAELEEALEVSQHATPSTMSFSWFCACKKVTYSVHACM